MKQKQPGVYALLTKNCIMNKQRRVKRGVIVAEIILAAIIISVGIIGNAQVRAEKYLEPAEVSVPEKIKELKIYKPEEAKELATKLAKEHGLNVDKFLKVIKCESGFQQFRTNANKDGSVDRGIAMWNSYWNSKLSDNQAYDVEYSLNKMADYWKEGKQGLWVCNRLVK
jgi:pimeloyl-CoA synthetase